MSEDPSSPVETSLTPGLSPEPMVTEMEPTEVARRLKATPDRVLLLDVREPFEREVAVIQPSLHIPMNEIPGEDRGDPEGRELIVYCHGGTRSMMVAGYLESRGFSRSST